VFASLVVCVTNGTMCVFKFHVRSPSVLTGAVFQDAIEEDHDWTIDTGEGMLRGDRLLTARGTTPRIEEGSIDVPDEYLDAEPSREAEFEELVARGATEFMCETFALEFTPETGIVAQVPGEFWDDFPPHFKTQDDWDQEADEVKLWKIYLGRRIVLDDDDPDGSQFIENFLEEVFYYPNKITLEAQWETLLEAPGVWVTRPKDSTMDDDDEIDSNLDDEETRRAYGDAPSEDNRSDHGPEAHMMVDGWECVRVHSAAETSETESDSDDSTQISSTYMEDNARAAQYSSQAESDFEGETMLQTRFVVRRRITRGTRIVSPVPNEDWSA
jgi:hypothetical protein